MESVKSILMQRDGMSAKEADEIIRDFKKELELLLYQECSLEEAYYLIEEHFGLEPDYLEEFLFQ